MSLSKEIILTIKDYSITLNNLLKFYVNDSLKLVFTINKMEIINANNINTISVDSFPLDGLTAQLLIENSQGTDSIEATSIENNKISFIFTNKFGYTEPYDIWKSENSNLGKITVVVG